jgi:regulator of cell morphogenesis and NO signaling
MNASLAVHTPSLTHQSTLADIAATHPVSLKVFHRHGLDFCCGGQRALSTACERDGLDAQQVLDEIAALEVTQEDVRWDSAPLTQLVDHIVARHHRPLDEELPRLEAMARRVNTVHGEKNPAKFQALLDTVLALREELDTHLVKEETVLFPWIQSGRPAADAQAPVRALMLEHEAVGELLRQTRELTDDYVAPLGACGTWRGLWAGLAELEIDLHRHIHLENNVLFPRALQVA